MSLVAYYNIVMSLVAYYNIVFLKYSFHICVRDSSDLLLPLGWNVKENSQKKKIPSRNHYYNIVIDIIDICRFPVCMYVCM